MRSNFHTDDSGVPSFPFSKEQLIDKVKELHATKFGTEKPELLADDFQFRFPIVELNKEKFIKAFGGFKVDEAFPDMCTDFYGFRMDPHIPGRIWYDSIGEGTHTGQFGGNFSYVKPTGKKISLPPQTNSMTFNEQGQLEYFTGGYVVDRRMGNTGGLGGLFGILHGVGYTLPFPEGKPFSMSWQFRLLQFIGKTVDSAKDLAAAYLPKYLPSVAGMLGYSIKTE